MSKLSLGLGSFYFVFVCFWTCSFVLQLFCVVVLRTHVFSCESPGGDVAAQVAVERRARCKACWCVCVSHLLLLSGRSRVESHRLLHSAFISCERTQIPCLFALAALMTPLISKGPWPDIPHIPVPLSPSPPIAVALTGLQGAQEQHSGLWLVLCDVKTLLPLPLELLHFSCDFKIWNQWLLITSLWNCSYWSETSFFSLCLLFKMHTVEIRGQESKEKNDKRKEKNDKFLLLFVKF